MDERAVTAADPLGPDEPLLAAAVGANWERYYRPRFATRAAGGPAWMWNHAAALVPFWMSFRRLEVSLPVHFVQVLGFAALAQLAGDAMPAEAAIGVGLIAWIVLAKKKRIADRRENMTGKVEA